MPYRGHGRPNSNPLDRRADSFTDSYDLDDYGSVDEHSRQDSHKGAADAEKASGRVSALELFRFYGPFDLLCVALGALCSFISGGATPMFMYLFGRMTSSAYTDTSNMDAHAELVTRNFAMLMTCIATLTLVLNFISTSCFLVSASRQTGRLKTAYFSAIIGMDISWHDVHRPGELMSRLFGDARLVQNGMNDRLGSGFQNLGMGLSGFVLSFIGSWELSLLICGVLPIVLVIVLIISGAMTRYTAQTRSEYAEAGAIAAEVIENIKTVQTFNRESFEADRFASAVLNSRSTGIKKEFLFGAAMGSSMGIMFVMFGIAFIFASYLVEWGRGDAGSVTAAFLSIMYGANGFGGVFPSLMGLMESSTAAYPLFRTIDRVPSIDVDERGPPCFFTDELVLDNVRFEYPSRPGQPIFEGLTVHIPKGSKIAFSGTTGCGKSTIMSLLQRFYDPTEGAIRVDGRDIRDYAVTEWRRLIAMVSQEPSLFTGSVLDNVRIGKPEATLEEVVRACKRARIHDTIVRLPRGYHTDIGAVGGQLSGGQKQRIAIARAIVRRAEILLLDEATSALDRRSEMEVQQALDELWADTNMTVITIAHRLDTIRHMDCIFFLDNFGTNGSYVAEYGTYDELVQRGGRFASMIMMQDTSTDVRNVASNTSFHLYKDSKKHLSGGGEGASTGVVYDTDGNGDGYALEGMNFVDYGESIKWHEVPNVEDVPFEKRTEWENRRAKVSMFRIIRLTSDNTWAIASGSFGSIISALTIPVAGLLISQNIVVLGEYELDKDAGRMRSRIWIFVPLFFALGVATFIASVITSFYGYVGEHLTYYLRTTLFRQILRQDQTFFDMVGRDPGSLGGILSGDCETVHQLYGPALGSRLRSAFTLIGGLVIGMVFEWRVAFVALSTMPLLIAGMIAQQVFFAKASNNRNEDLDTTVSESLSAIRTVNAFSMKHRMLLRYRRSVNREQYTSEKRSVLIAAIVALTQFVSLASVALSFWYGGQLIQKGETGFGNVLIATMTISMGTSFAGAEAGGFATKVRDAREAAKKVFAIIDRVPDVDTYVYGETDWGDRCDIVFDRVSFRYPARPLTDVLRHVSMSLPRGTSSGLMGQTGCGKSTVIQLLARFYIPTQGTIWVNDVDLNTLDTVTWRDSISIVLQEPALFSGTVRENIRYSKADATDLEVEEAARIACIHEEILAMDDGYDTQVGYRGRGLSGGQKQRVAIARGVLRCPQLLLLDEATSALDNVTEAAVQLNLDAYQRRFGVTIVSIAHRLTTIRYCDQIVVLDSGKVIEKGSHEELINQHGEYRARWELTQQ